MFPGVYGALPSVPPAGRCHLSFVKPYRSLLLHLSFFSVFAFFKTAVVFLTLDFFLLLSGEHEDDRDTVCMVLASRGAAASDVSDHPLLHCCISSSEEEEEEAEGVCFCFTRHPFISLLIPLSSCVL